MRNRDLYIKRISLKNPIHFLSLGLGSGLTPIIPGTAGSFAAIFVWLLFYQWSCPVYWGAVLLAFLLGCFFCGYTAKAMGTHDHGSIVWDEFVGMWMVLYFIPTVSWPWVAIAFVLFRFFDMVKPWPIKWFDQKVAGGVGIMLDDVIAALFAALVLYGLTLTPLVLYLGA